MQTTTKTRDTDLERLWIRSTTAGYTNPHAPLYVASSTLTYDNNGNLTAYSTTSSYTWDYRNRITQIKSNVASSTAAATSSFDYDQDNQRTYQIVKATTTATSTTHYPGRYFSKVSSISGATTTSTSTNYIYAGDTLVATIEQKFVNNIASGTPITYFYHPDHLGSTNVVTSATGTILHTLDYYPYGAQRINRNTTATKANRQYIGQFTDSATSLSYLQNRYLDNSRGQFMEKMVPCTIFSKSRLFQSAFANNSSQTLIVLALSGGISFEFF